jgi:hypothetical protein
MISTPNGANKIAAAWLNVSIRCVHECVVSGPLPFPLLLPPILPPLLPPLLLVTVLPVLSLLGRLPEQHSGTQAVGFVLTKNRALFFAAFV